MATSPSFNWPEPDNTDLVKNGALAIRTAVDAIDTSMTDLLGGTTGQVLSKTSATDMDFTWATPATSPTSYGYSAGKNKIINADFGIWQRGTSFNPSAIGFFMFADRWRSYTYSASATTATQQAFTPGTAPVAGYEGSFFGRVVSTNTFAYFSYNGIENVRTFAGQEVTLSYWAKSAAGQTLNEVQVAQYFGSTGSAAVSTNLTAPTITTSWVRYTHTFTMPSISGKTISGGNDSIYINIKGAINNALDIWGMQLEAGSIATPFQTATGTIAGELAACQRYYYRNTPGTTYGAFGLGQTKATDQAIIPINLPVTMRTNVASIDYANVCATNPSDAAVTAASSLTINYSGSSVVLLAFGGTGAFAGAADATVLRANNSTTAFIGFSAEL